MEVVKYIPGLSEYFQDHPELFKKANTAWAKTTKEVMERSGKTSLHPFYGKCFPMAEFVHNYLGDGSQMKCLRGKTLIDEIKTTHWFCVKDGIIYDLSGGQFEDFEPLTQEDYANARNAAFGLRRFSYNGVKSKEYPTVVPSRVTMSFAEAMKASGIDIKGLNPWLDDWLDHFKYALSQ